MRYVKTRLAEIKAAKAMPPPEWHELPLGYLVSARFWSKVDVRDGLVECWEWKGAFHGNGYGNFRVPGSGRRNIQAHRMAFLLANSRLPDEGLVVRHKCDNPRCVNPHHLEAGTKAENYQDMIRARTWKLPTSVT